MITPRKQVSALENLKFKLLRLPYHLTIRSDDSNLVFPAKL
jgi:hypothetical protein